MQQDQYYGGEDEEQQMDQNEYGQEEGQPEKFVDEYGNEIPQEEVEAMLKAQREQNPEYGGEMEYGDEGGQDGDDY